MFYHINPLIRLYGGKSHISGSKTPKALKIEIVWFCFFPKNNVNLRNFFCNSGSGHIAGILPHHPCVHHSDEDLEHRYELPQLFQTSN